MNHLLSMIGVIFFAVFAVSSCKNNDDKVSKPSSEDIEIVGYEEDIVTPSLVKAKNREAIFDVVTTTEMKTLIEQIEAMELPLNKVIFHAALENQFEKPNAFKKYLFNEDYNLLLIKIITKKSYFYVRITTKNDKVGEVKVEKMNSH